MNLKAIKLQFPSINLIGIEINKLASEQLAQVAEAENVFNGSIYDYEHKRKFDVALIKGAPIHINPDMLPEVYERLYQSSSKFILICEYYNPVPMMIDSRGHNDRMYKRDFAGEMLDKYSDSKLFDYSICYARDKAYLNDYNTWFLLEKKQAANSLFFCKKLV